MAKKQSRCDSLKAWREKHTPKLSQRAAARQFGLSQQGWQKIEAGIHRPRRTLAGRLWRGTGVPLAVLMGIE